MWTAPVPVKPWLPPNATTKPSSLRHRSSVPVHNRQRSDESTAPKSKEPSHQNSAQSERLAQELPQQQQRQQKFSGADVLMALQNATPRTKSREKTTEKRGFPAVSKRTNKDGGGRDVNDNHRTTEFRNLRSLRVKAEWSRRLEELESRLRELQHRSFVSGIINPFGRH